MQKLAAYRLESQVHDKPEDVAGLVEEVRGLVHQWLEGKGAAEDGTYAAKDDSDARYSEKAESHDGNTWDYVELVETSEDGRRFVAGLSVTATPDQVIVYGTLAVGVVSSQVNVVAVDPRCPAILRSLLSDAGPWYHGSSRLSAGLRVAGFEQGEQLANHLLDPTRRLPIVVVSGGGPAELADLYDKIAYDLGGLANVVAVDFDASWALTDTLGLALTCHSGAVRIYWPRLTLESNRYRHPLWTANRILGARSAAQASAILRRQLRRTVMSASAVSVIRPAAIDQIRAGAAAARLRDLRESAASLVEWRGIAELFAEENDALRSEADSLKGEISQLSDLVQRADSDTAALKYQLQSLGEATEAALEDIEPDFSEELQAPESGEIRFYKKQYSAPGHDIFIHVADCGHSSWQNASKAEKAKKGVARLENSDGWSKIQHCGSCTGGGRWRVRW